MRNILLRNILVTKQPAQHSNVGGTHPTDEAQMTMAAKSVTFKLPDGATERSREGGAATLPKTSHPKLLHSPPSEPHSSPESSCRPLTSQQALRDSREGDTRPQSRPSSEQSTFVLDDRQKKTPPHTSTRRRQFSTDDGRNRLGKPSDLAAAVHAARERTNSASRDNIRSLKYGVARLRESLLRVEEEVKRMTRGRRTLELAVQDVRRAISVNQQSVSVQQKKTRAQTVKK